MLLGTYRLQDPNGRELAALVHGNRLIKANIRTAEELRELWASPRAKDKLRKRNRNVELVPSYVENTDVLDRHLQDDGDEEDEIEEIEEMDLEIGNEETRENLKRKREMYESIEVREGTPPEWARQNTTPSPNKVSRAKTSR